MKIFAFILVLVASNWDFGSAQLINQVVLPATQCTLTAFAQLIKSLGPDLLSRYSFLNMSTPQLLANRQNIFLENCKIMEANKAQSYISENNIFSLMTPLEKSTTSANAIAPTNYAPPTTTIREKRQATTLPQTVDWRTKNVLTPVKNQGQCGCCWAYAAMAALEPAMALKTKTSPVSLSEQELVDCSAQECNGGYMDQAYKYIVEKKGVTRTTNYPAYSAKRNTCVRSTTSVISASVASWVWVASDELSLQKAVAERPVTTAIFVAPSLYNYKSGIYYEANCNNPPNDVNHGILVIGYGTENGTDYWTCKNSWGAAWGDNGYFKLARNRGNNCFIAKYPLYPVVP